MNLSQVECQRSDERRNCGHFGSDRSSLGIGFHAGQVFSKCKARVIGPGVSYSGGRAGYVNIR